MTFASVLGGFARTNLSDFNDMKDWGCWQILDTQNISNAPENADGSGFMLVYGWYYGNASRSIQMLVIQDNKIYIRCFNGFSWQSWRGI